MARSDSKKLPPHEQNISRRDLFSIGIGATVISPSAFLYEKPNLLPPPPPPIIIKTGSFIIDSVDGFKDAGSIAGNPKRKRLNQYKGSFGLIRRILVNQINEIPQEATAPARPESYPFQNDRGLIIQIWLQKLINENPETWDPADITGVADVESRLVSPLALELPEDLDKSNNNKHQKRKNKDKLDFKKDAGGRDRFFRFGRIQILDADQKVLRDITSINGDEYIISLWDKI